MLVSILSDIEALSFETIAEFYGGDEPVDIPAMTLGLHPEDEGEDDDVG